MPTRLLHRKINSCKKDFGHVFVLAGSLRYSGAAVLCAQAALRSGAGLVTLGIPNSLNNAVIKIKPKEVITLPLPQTMQAALSLTGYKEIKEFIKKADITVIGPGLGQDKSTFALVRKLVSNTNKPLVIDADGLNALVGYLELLRKTKDEGRETIFTPHPGEMAKLIGCSVKKVQDGRVKCAEYFAKKYKVVLVLKGNNTIVADYKSNIFINKTGNPGMASAGTGDVLTGMIAAFLAQGLDSFNAAKYAVYLHGFAGDLAAKEKTQISLIASDIIDKIPEAIKKCS
ncbi:MAG: NAD(P)H-hydrate dehydratase [Candidatus Omnitrophota bacterium]